MRKEIAHVLPELATRWLVDASKVGKPRSKERILAINEAIKQCVTVYPSSFSEEQVKITLERNYWTKTSKESGK